MMKTLLKYFLQGLLYTAPVAVTLYVFYEAFQMLDSILELDYPGLGILFIFCGITLIGVAGSYLLRFPIFDLVEDKLERLPLFSLIYTSIKDVIKSFTGQRKGFKHPVVIKLYEGSEIRRLGFVTDESLDLLGDDENTLVTVYVPHSFAISGQLFLVPPKYISKVNESSADVMKYILAGGITEVGDKEEEEED